MFGGLAAGIMSGNVMAVGSSILNIYLTGKELNSTNNSSSYDDINKLRMFSSSPVIMIRDIFFIPNSEYIWRIRSGNAMFRAKKPIFGFYMANLLFEILKDRSRMI